MKIAICDDDRSQILLLEAYIKKWTARTGVDTTVSSFVSAENFLINWTSPTMFDLVFMDIKMNKMSGIELAEFIRKDAVDIEIVFVTGTRDFVFQGYDVGALNYLLKPISEEECAKCLDKALLRLPEKEEGALILDAGGSLSRIKYKDIVYIESRSHYLSFYTKTQEFQKRKKIAEIESELTDKPEFIRIHRSYIVNLRHVVSCDDGDVFLEDGKSLPISRSRRKEVHIAFVSYYAHN